MNVGMMKPPYRDLGHAAAAKHQIRKRAGTNTETISIPVGLCMASLPRPLMVDGRSID
jgi:hypothetical protein